MEEKCSALMALELSGGGGGGAVLLLSGVRKQVPASHPWSDLQISVPKALNAFNVRNFEEHGIIEAHGYKVQLFASAM